MRHYRNKGLGWSNLIDHPQTVPRVVDKTTCRRQLGAGAPSRHNDPAVSKRLTRLAIGDALARPSYVHSL
jgi:hypothetical protein